MLGADFHEAIYRSDNSMLADFLSEMYSFGLRHRRLVLLTKAQ